MCTKHRAGRRTRARVELAGNTLTWTVTFATLDPAVRDALPVGALYRLEALSAIHPKAHSNGNGVLLDVTPVGVAT